MVVVWMDKNVNIVALHVWDANGVPRVAVSVNHYDLLVGCFNPIYKVVVNRVIVIFEQELFRLGKRH